MESDCFQEYTSLVNEITKGKEQVQQLRASSSRDQEAILERMLASYEEALSILNGNAPEEQRRTVISSASDPPDSSSLSLSKITQSRLLSVDSEKRMEQVQQQRAVLQRTFKRKKTLSTWNAAGKELRTIISSASDPPDSSSLSLSKITQSKLSSMDSEERVTMRTDTLSEVPDDGFSWRKYGEKEILGSKYPRSYYRCTHHRSKGCMARKQVQRSEDDPFTIEVIDRGKHTCLGQEPVVLEGASREKHE